MAPRRIVAPVSSPPRPIPPEDMQLPLGRFAPARELAAWARAVFLEETSRLYSPTHADIIPARIAFLWTSEAYSSGGRSRLGDAGLASPPRAVFGWDAALYRYQMETWFGDWFDGEAPDFRIRIYAPYFAECSDVDALALLKHELLHCRQAVDEFDCPRYRKAGSHRGEPIWAIRAHPVEEFPEVVRDFGAGVHDGAVQDLVDAAARSPRIGRASITAACGTCMRKAA